MEWDYRSVAINDMLTRDDVLQVAHGKGWSLPETTFVSWEKQGILPRPIRRRRDGAPRALYPPYAVNVAIAICKLRAIRMPLEQIVEVLRVTGFNPAAWGSEPDDISAEAAIACLKRAHVEAGLRVIGKAHTLAALAPPS